MTWFSKRLSLFWLLLVGISVLSFESSLAGSNAAGAIVIGIGLLKGWVVGWEYMDIRRAAMSLKILFNIWVVAVGAALLFVLYRTLL
ncbi:MAG TPA: hypothetical protein PLM58_09010 [Novosphingobium sp.]|nr:hypothetical protein [Novosphingobium sp.]